MKRLGLWRACASALAIVAATPAAAGTGHQWGDYLWDESYKNLSLNISYKFDSTSTWLPYYDYALDLWQNNSRSMIHLNNTGEDNSTTGAACEANVGEVLVCASAYGSTGWVGIAQIEANGNFITQATAKFNDTYYAMPQYNNDGQRKFVACHEIGHTWGLGHLDTAFYNPNKGSCMDYTADPDGPPDNRIPGTKDWDVLNSITMYGDLVIGKTKGGGKPGRLDPFEFRTVGGSSASTATADAPRGRWGVAVGYDAEGRPNEFLLDRGNGRHQRTFVTWIPGYKPKLD